MNDCNAWVEAYVGFFESLDMESLNNLEAVFSESATFKDPFNAVRGRRAIRQVFEHMFRTTRSPRFRIHDWMCAGNAAFIRWRFTCSLKGRGIDVTGVSHVEFDGSGRVTAHIDYWDAAEGMYERLPVIGFVLRWLRPRLAA
jgi:ketosteroid isomerase-like protein